MFRSFGPGHLTIVRLSTLLPLSTVLWLGSPGKLAAQALVISAPDFARDQQGVASQARFLERPYQSTHIPNHDPPRRQAQVLRQVQANLLLQQASLLVKLGKPQAALRALQTALPIYQDLGDRTAQGHTLNQMGVAYKKLGQYQNAIETLNRALKLRTELGDRLETGITLSNIGVVYRSLSQYQNALDTYHQALTIFRALGNRPKVGVILNNIGTVHSNLGQYQEALKIYAQALEIHKTVGDRAEIGATLHNIALVQKSLGNNQSALRNSHQALTIFKSIRDRTKKGSVLIGIGSIYRNLDQHQQSLNLYQQALVSFREVDDLAGEGRALNEIGVTYTKLSQYQDALKTYQQALAIRRQVSDRAGEGTTLSNIGLVYSRLSQYQSALENFNQALAIRDAVGDLAGKSTTLNNIASVYYRLGQYQEALETYTQALDLTRAVGNRAQEGTNLSNIGAVRNKLGQYEQALTTLNQALTIHQAVGNRSGQGSVLNNLAGVYKDLNQYQPALTCLNQALDHYRAAGNRAGEGNVLTNLGWLYNQLDQHEQALAASNQALVIHRDSGNRTAEAGTLSTLGQILSALQHPQVAIVFFKDAVNTLETIRRDIQGLSSEQQQTYLDSIAGIYRDLADLLLQQDRVLEAQQVLDLLKVQELEDYLQDVRGQLSQTRGIPTLPVEQPVAEELDRLFDQAIALGQELQQLRQSDPNTRTPPQQARIAELVQAQAQITAAFQAFIRSDTVLALVRQQDPAALSQDLLLRLGDFNGLRGNLKQLGNAVLFYPLILDDRIELILTAPDSPPIRRQVAVSKAELNGAIRAFREALQQPNTHAQQPAQQLYQWLIAPLAADLAAAGTETIIYAPDGPLRYIPLAALHDGDQWLVQRYRINNITAASLTDLDTRPQPQLRVLAGALTAGEHQIRLGGETFEFAGLPFAKVELDNLAQTVPATTSLLDQAFNPAATVPQMDDHTIVHLATHGAIILGQPEDSFILFGNGAPVTLREIRNWSLTNVDLMVLSACETGVGGQLGNGEEILGLGYQLQRAGARAVIASLWQVSDGGTQVLMNGFYTALSQGLTKAEALRQAQIALITGDEVTTGMQRASLVPVDSRAGLPPTVSSDLDHPYYWAPFILIGNGL